MSDTSKDHHEEVYDQDGDDDQDVVYDNDQQEEVSHNEESAPENYNMRYQQHDEENDENNQEEEHHEEEDDQHIEDEDENQEEEEEEQEERVVRAQNNPSAQHHEQLQQQSSKEMDSKQKRNEFLRQENRSLSNNDEDAAQNGQLERQQSSHQQKLEQEKQILQQQQQQSRQLQKQKSQQDSILFSQFLNEMLDQYRTTMRAFKSIDRHNKGFIELNDLAIELVARFGIEVEAQHKEIFVKLGHGNARINRDLFDAAFEDIVHERQRQQQEALASMNVVSQSYDPGHSPFKDKQEREEIINILRNPKQVNLEEANKVEHFSDDSLYAPVIRRLRQQPNFNEFVRSYNSLQFPKYQVKPSSASSSTGLNSFQAFSQIHSLQPNQPAQLKQQSLLRHELFANPQSRSYRGAQQLLDEYRQSAAIAPNHHTSGSPLRQLKISTQTFSPNRFYQSLDSPKDFMFERNLHSNIQIAPQNNKQQRQSGVRFLSPQYNRKPNQTFLGFEFGTQNYQSQIQGNQLKQSQGNFNNNNNFNQSYKKPTRNNMNNSRLFASQEINKESDFLHRSYVMSPNQVAQTFGSSNPLFQSLSLNFNSNNNNLFASDYNSATPTMPNLMQSSYIGQRIDLRSPPNQSNLNKLKRKVNTGLEGLSQVHRPRIDGNNALNQSLLNPNGNSSRNIKEQFNQYLSQLGGSSSLKIVQTSPQRVAPSRAGGNKIAYPLEDENDRFGDILSRLQGGSFSGRTTNRSLEKKRNTRQVNLDVFGAAHASPFRNNSFKKSQSPNFNLSPSGPRGGVNGNLQRVKQIQASLRALPNKQKVRISRNNSKSQKGKYFDKKSSYN